MELTVDAVVFSYIEEKLNLLVIRRNLEPFKNKLALAGGFVNEDETTEEAVLRKLEDETNVRLNYLEQLYTFSDIHRDPRGRIITVAYYGLVDSTNYELVNNIHAKEVFWLPVDEIEDNEFAFDHKKIIDYGLIRLANKVRYEPIGFELLPPYFSMTDIWKLYCAVLGEEIDRRNFTKKILKTGILVKTELKTQNKGAGRKAQLYCFDSKKYESLKEKGFIFEI